jgi:alpha-aminoadipic semialdehyde synthase
MGRLEGPPESEGRLEGELRAEVPEAYFQVYACQIPASAYLQRIKGGGYDRTEYYAKPELYHSMFGTTIAPYLTTLIHGAGWSSGYPRILTNKATDEFIKASPAGRQKMVAVQDVSCDIEVSCKSTNMS